MKTISDKELLGSLLKKHKLEHFFPAEYHQHLQLLLFRKGQAICLQDQDITFIGYTVSGSVKIVRRLFNGKEHILETQSNPCIIGDIELMTDQKAVTSVIALEDTYFIQLPLRNKTELLKNPDFLYQIGHELASHFYQQNIRSSTNISYSVKERLASYILENENEGQFTLNLTLLADSLGTSYRHLHRVLSQLINQQIIERRAFKNYYILDKSKIEKLTIHD